MLWKNLNKANLFIVSLLFITHLHAKIGCMATYTDLRPVKEGPLQYVSCNCLCLRMIAEQNKCLQCHHVHMPKETYIIHYDPTKTYDSPQSKSMSPLTKIVTKLLTKSYLEQLK